MLKAGRVIAEGTPESSNRWAGTGLTSFSPWRRHRGPVAKLLQQFASGELRIDVESNRISVPVADRTCPWSSWRRRS